VSKMSMTVGLALAIGAVVALMSAAARAQSISLPDGGSVSIDIGDTGGSVSVTAPSIGVDFNISFGGAGGDPGSVSGIGGQSAGVGGVAVLGKSRGITIPGLSDAATAGPSGGSEQASRSLANAAPGNGPTARGLEGEFVAGVQGPGYNVPGFFAGPVGSYGVDAPPGPSISSTGSYTVADPNNPSQPNDASFAISAPDTPSGEQGAGAAPNGFNPINADQGVPIGGVGLAGIGPPPGGRPGEVAPAEPPGTAAPLAGANGLAIPAPAGTSLLGQGIATGPADRAPPPNPVPPKPVVTVFVVDEGDDLFDEISDLLGVSRDVIFDVYEQNAENLAEIVSRGDRDALVATLIDLADQVRGGARGPLAASTVQPIGGFKNLAEN